MNSWWSGPRSAPCGIATLLVQLADRTTDLARGVRRKGEAKEIVTGSGIRSGSQLFRIGLKTLAVARSMWTGMIGASRPLRIRSMPRLERQSQAGAG